MKDNVKKLLAGTGVLAAGAAGAVAAVRGTSEFMVGLAMDRREPPLGDRGFGAVSGSGGSQGAEKLLEAAARELEAQPVETVRVRSHDGLELVGHWYPAARPRRIVVAMHGWRSGWSRDFGVIAPFWYRQGCSVLFAEQRGQGLSDGAYMGFGMLERRDCLQWARYVQQRTRELPIYLAGVSMGATTVLMASALELPDRVRGIVADCGFTSPRDIWSHVVRENLHLHYGLYASTVERLCRKRIRMGSRDCSTTEALGSTPLPVLLIHGTEDTFVPISMTYENYRACAGPRRLLVVPGAGHGMSYMTDRALYEKKVAEFWDEFDGTQG